MKYSIRSLQSTTSHLHSFFFFNKDEYIFLQNGSPAIFHAYTSTLCNALAVAGMVIKSGAEIGFIRILGLHSLEIDPPLCFCKSGPFHSEMMHRDHRYV